jgi:CspA family cold shock protein
MGGRRACRGVPHLGAFPASTSFVKRFLRSCSFPAIRDSSGFPARRHTVTWFSVARKYGFIIPDEGGKDVFIHMSALAAAGIPYLGDGTKVSFDLDESTIKRTAVNLGLLAVGLSETAAAS